MFNYPLSTPQSYCQLCGATLTNVSQHRLFHESLDNLVRRVVAPELTEAEWKQQTTSPLFVERANAKLTQRLSEIEVEEAFEHEIREAEATIEREGVASPEF